MNHDENEDLGRRAAETARMVLGEEKAVRIEALFGDGEQVKRLYGNLSERDKQAVEAVLRNPQLLKNLLSSPKAMEGLQKLLGGKENG